MVAAIAVAARRPLVRGGPRLRQAAGFLLLIADADQELTGEMTDLLAGHRVASIVCPDGAEALFVAGVEHPDAVIAAATLPTVGGAIVARVLAARTTIPVLVGVGGGDGPAAAEALAAGAAACVAHPYRLREFLPILRAVRPETALEPAPVLECGALRLDLASHEIRLRGRLVRMPLRELRLLQLLMIHADRVVTREHIHAAVWGGVPGSNTITVHVQRLRQRLDDDQVDPKLILTVRGVGYRLVPPL